MHGIKGGFPRRQSPPIVRITSVAWGGDGDDLDGPVHLSRICVSHASVAKRASVTPDELELKGKISALVESVKGDRVRSNQLFQYIWTMMCVRRGLMRVVREFDTSGTRQLVLEEVRTGQHRLVARPRELDRDLEGLAVQALARILSEF